MTKFILPLADDTDLPKENVRFPQLYKFLSWDLYPDEDLFYGINYPCPRKPYNLCQNRDHYHDPKFLASELISTWTLTLTGRNKKNELKQAQTRLFNQPKTGFEPKPNKNKSDFDYLFWEHKLNDR